MEIIVVDDEAKIRGGLAKLLDSYESWHVAGAFGDAAQALRFLQENPADVLVTDIRMPDMSGLDLVRALREANSEMVVIILSGYSDFSYAQTAIELGVRRYLTKPTNVSELVGVLSEVETQLRRRVQAERQDADAETTNRIVAQAIDYIRSGYARKITLGSMGEALHVSPNYLCRLFKDHTGKGLTEYLTAYRMKQARSLLKNTDHTVAQVAELVGFADTKYFSILFKKVCGITPMEYRNGKPSKGA